jgi:HK97 family phage prohead protease
MTVLAERKLPSLRIELAAKVDAVDDDGDRPVMRGTAATYGVRVDRGYGLEMELVPGCFAKSAKEAHRVMLLWQHDETEPIGRMLSLADSPRRLQFEARLTTSPAVPTAAKARDLYRDKVLDEVSVGFDVLKFERVEDAEHDTVLYRVLEARLREVSCVTFGALGADARVSSVNAEAGGVDVRVLEARRLAAEVARLLA